MTTQEENLIIDKFGENYSYWDIPAYIRKRDGFPVPEDKTAPYWKSIRNPRRFKGESKENYLNRIFFTAFLR